MKTINLPNNIPKTDELHSSLQGMGEVITLKRAEYNTADPDVYRFIKDVRKELLEHPTHAEIMLWKYLKNNQTGYKFRRQHVIGRYIVDFVCLPKKLIIEVDGKTHIKQQVNDAIRTADLNALGFRVIRFKNEDVFINVANVVADIKTELDL